MDKKVQQILDGVRSDPLWQTYWVPLKAAVESGEITRESALRQWKAILDEEFAKQAKGRGWNG
jgi:hypothetical protein